METSNQTSPSTSVSYFVSFVKAREEKRPFEFGVIDDVFLDLPRRNSIPDEVALAIEYVRNN